MAAFSKVNFHASDRHCQCIQSGILKAREFMAAEYPDSVIKYCTDTMASHHDYWAWKKISMHIIDEDLLRTFFLYYNLYDFTWQRRSKGRYGSLHWTTIQILDGALLSPPSSSLPFPLPEGDWRKCCLRTLYFKCFILKRF